MATKSRRAALWAVGATFILVAGACGGNPASAPPTEVPTPSSSQDAGASAQPSNEPAPARAITVALSTDIPGLDPHERDTSAMRQVTFNNVYDSLIRWAPGATSQLEASLATEWTYATPTTLRLSLREGVTFHNGEPFNADAAVFSIKRVLDPATASEIAGTLETVADATAVDDMTVEVTTTGPDPILANRLTRIMMVPPGYLADDSAKLRDAPIGTGPYAFVSRTADGVVLQAFDGYWGPAPQVTDVTFVTRLDTAARVAALEAGEADVIADLPADAADRAPKVLEIPTLEVGTLRLNGDGGLTKDVRVREAIAHAIDTESIREAFFGERAVPARGQIVPEGVAGFNPDVQAAAYDPDRARALLEESGIGDQPLRFMIAEGRFPKAREIAEAVTAQLQDVGFTVDLQVMDFQRWLDEILNSGPESFELSYSRTGSDNLHDSTQPFSLWVPEDGLAQVMPDEAQPEAEAAYKVALTEVNLDKRTADLQTVTRLINESYYHVPFFVENQIWGAAADVTWDLTQDDQIRLSTMRVGG